MKENIVIDYDLLNREDVKDMLYSKIQSTKRFSQFYLYKKSDDEYEVGEPTADFIHKYPIVYQFYVLHTDSYDIVYDESPDGERTEYLPLGRQSDR